MEPVSARFISALQRPHTIATEVTYTIPGGDPEPVKIKSGSVTVDAGGRVRRRANLRLFADGDTYQRMALEGTLFSIRHGLNFGTSRELVPVFTGEIVSGAREFGKGAGEVQFPLQDLGVWIGRSDLVTPYLLSAGTSRAAAITYLVNESRPGSSIVDTSGTGGGTVGVEKVFTGSRADAIRQLALDGGLETFWSPSGVFVIRDEPTGFDSPVWSTAGVLKRLARNRPMDKLYNTVVVRPSATDGSQTWTQAVVSITNPAHPRHPDKIGVVPYVHASPTILDSGTAYAAANKILSRVLGTTETLRLEAISNPALDAGDVLRITTPRLNTDRADTFQHFTDGFTLDLDTGAMTLDTRSQLVA